MEVDMTIALNIQKHMRDSSWIRRMFELGLALKAERGEDNVFDLSLGNPVVEPPQEFHDELEKYVQSYPKGVHRYMPNGGYGFVRQSIADSLSRETGLEYQADNVMMSVGAAGALNVIVHALCNPDDEVLILSPYFAEYLFYASNHHAKPVVVEPHDDLMPDLVDLSNKITPKTRIIILNSPNNPSGVVYPDSTVKAIGKILSEKEREYKTKIFLVSDEPYRKIIFDGYHYPFPQHHYKRTVTVTSHAKDLALPGERIGYLALSPKIDEAQELMDAFIFCNRVLGFVNAPAIMQHLVSNLQDVTIDVKNYEAKRDFLYSALIDAGYEVRKPEGAFYMFPKSPVEDEMELINALQDEGVLVVPGRGFGVPGYFRISYCVDNATLEGAIPGFRNAINKLKWN
tara:strand:- start:116 stop:1315 length:1200 start_codon:yes stop_codon:yes gene_type:complete